jgi:hypothetical protein
MLSARRWQGAQESGQNANVFDYLLDKEAWIFQSVRPQQR